MKCRKILTGAAALVAVAAGTAGCAGDANGGPGGSGRFSDTITIGLAAASMGRNLDMIVNQDGSTDAFGYNVYETLTRLDPEGSVQPLLATSWKADGNSWIFTLRRGVKFHDGTDFDAEDVVASYSRFLDPSMDSPIVGFLLPNVDTITADGADTVVIKNKTYDASIPAQLQALPITRSEWADVKSDKLSTGMNGTGPYKLDSFQRDQTASLVRFDDYWGDKPAYAKAEFKFMPDPTVRLAALKSGEINMAYNLAPDLVQGDDNVVSSPLSEVMVLRLKSLSPDDPLSDPDLRAAVNMSIDRETICKTLYAGQCTFTKAQINIPQVFGFNGSLEDAAYDPVKAKQILKDKGALGTKLSLAVPVGRWQHDKELGQVIEKSLTDVGFTVDAQYSEIAKWAVQHTAIHKNPDQAADVDLYGTSNDYMDSGYQLDGSIACAGANSAHCDPAMDREIVDAKAVTDLEERRAAFEAIWQKVADQHLWAPILSINQVTETDGSFDWTPIIQPRVIVSDMTPSK